MREERKVFLIADDDEDWRYLLDRLLTSEGYRVLQAGDCLAALSVVAGTRVNCVIADIKLGNEDGRRICCQMKANPEFSGIHVIMISGSGEDLSGCGCDAYLCKSDGIEHLLSVVRQLVLG